MNDAVNIEVPEGRYIYELTDGNLMYVGISKDPTRRLEQHKAKGRGAVKTLAQRGRMTIIAGPVSDDAAGELERALIKVHRENKHLYVLNVAHGGQMGGKKTGVPLTRESAEEIETLEEAEEIETLEEAEEIETLSAIESAKEVLKKMLLAVLLIFSAILVGSLLNG